MLFLGRLHFINIWKADHFYTGFLSLQMSWIQGTQRPALILGWPSHKVSTSFHELQRKLRVKRHFSKVSELRVWDLDTREV